MNIHLTEEEIKHAISVGCARQMSSIKKNLKNANGFEGDEWGVNIEGAMGELATAKALNMNWDATVDTFKANDLEGIQVRTRSNHYWDLIIRPNDDDEAIWVLVTGKNGKYVVRGWCYGHEGKKKQWLKDYANRPPAYFIPQKFLKSINLIKHCSKCNN